MKTVNVFLSGVLAMSVLTSINAYADSESNRGVVDRGRYLIKIAACNDCHTPGYAQADGKVPEADWLVGSSVGFSGPWGTTYPTNLRLKINSITQSQWVAAAQHPKRPPMPWFILRDMTENDLVAIYRFVRYLGPAGNPAPAYVPPGEAVTTPYIEFFPKNLPNVAQVDR